NRKSLVSQAIRQILRRHPSPRHNVLVIGADRPERMILQQRSELSEFPSLAVVGRLPHSMWPPGFQLGMQLFAPRRDALAHPNVAREQGASKSKPVTIGARPVSIEVEDGFKALFAPWTREEMPPRVHRIRDMLNSEANEVRGKLDIGTVQKVANNNLTFRLTQNEDLSKITTCLIGVLANQPPISSGRLYLANI
ncbi:MAG: hypothetical protein ACJ8E8_01950, partial [Sphingomicrobium sp.]